MKNIKKENKKSSKFATGALLGVALGVAASAFAKSKKGKEIGKDLKKKSGELYKYLEPHIKEAKKLGEKEYQKFLKLALDEHKKTSKSKKRK